MTWSFYRTEPKILILNALINKKLELRANILRAIRIFFAAHNYLEVETPIRIPAPAPEAHIEG
ncbi:MAG: hypothetical protein KKD92_10170 [Proteobacteria bacterium]|nr:hypothetical protein [Pseudomonadota bacterium]